MITTFTRNTVHALKKDSPWGIYIVQSAAVPAYYRIGVSGIKAPIWKRLDGHRGGAPKERKNPPNWTELNRPWKVIWLAQLQAATEAAVLNAEHYLCGLFSQRYPFVSESGFQASEDASDDIVKMAESALPAINKIVTVQVLSLFKKEPKTGERWRAAR